MHRKSGCVATADSRPFSGVTERLCRSEAWFALGLTAFAGLAAGIGRIIAFTAKLSSYRFLAVATGFSAGAMLCVSFVEIFLRDSVVTHYGGPRGYWINAASFFGGMLHIGLIGNIGVDELLPTSRAYGQVQDSLFGLAGGMVVRALSLLLMR